MYNTNYDGWWGHDTLPKLNYEDSMKLENYIIYWKEMGIPPYNVDGWRLDVAADLGRSNEYNHQFWKKFARRSRMPIQRRLFLPSITEIPATGFKAMSGIRS